MYDSEIKNYLNKHNWSISASSGLADIFNTSPQIKQYRYDPDNKTMTIETPENTFIFKWILDDLTSHN